MAAMLTRRSPRSLTRPSPIRPSASSPRTGTSRVRSPPAAALTTSRIWSTFAACSSDSRCLRSAAKETLGRQGDQPIHVPEPAELLSLLLVVLLGEELDRADELLSGEYRQADCPREPRADSRGVSRHPLEVVHLDVQKVALLPACAAESLTLPVAALIREAKEFGVGVAFLVGSLSSTCPPD